MSILGDLKNTKPTEVENLNLVNGRAGSSTIMRTSIVGFWVMIACLVPHHYLMEGHQHPTVGGLLLKELSSLPIT